MNQVMLIDLLVIEEQSFFLLNYLVVGLVQKKTTFIISQK